MLKKSDGSYGVMIGNKTVFTREAAEEYYKLFCKVAYRNLTMGSSMALSEVRDDMHNKLEYSYVELEEMEIEVLEQGA